MDNFIDYIHVRNFKSVKECNIEGCKRINLLIGRPNVGKSNILEALSLFSIPFLKEGFPNRLTNLIRLEHEAELFYHGNIEEFAQVHTNTGVCKVTFAPKEGLTIYMRSSGKSYMYQISDRFRPQLRSGGPVIESQIKKYTFKHPVFPRKAHAKYLIPPYGPNLLTIITNYPELKQEVSDLFAGYSLQIAFDKASQTIKIIQETKDGIFLIPYNSIADTLQRVIFYKAAIASNTNSVLLFEEPEAHSFPPYMSHLTQEMIYKKDNQYFIATHSPFILNDLLENGREELAVFIVHYEEGETRVRLLSREELHQTYQNGVDLFTNSESFI